MRPILCAVLFLCSLSAFPADISELRERRQRAAAEFSDGILLIHANDAGDEAADAFRQDAAFYYLTGLENTAGAILAIDGRARQSWLFLRPPGKLEREIAAMKGFRDEGAPAGMEHVAQWSELAGLLDRNKASGAVLYYGVRFGSRPELPGNIAGEPEDAPLWIGAIARKWPAYRLKEAGARITALMDLQSASEMVSVRAAAKATVRSIIAGLGAIRPGVSQRRVEIAVVNACWKEGAQGASFWPWVMAGPKGVYPMPWASATRYDHLDGTMNAGDLVRLDVGCDWNHYGGDLGRTVPVSGRYSAEQREIWDSFVAAYHAGVKSLREGVTEDQVFEVWSAELVRHRQSAKSALAKEAIEAWSKRGNVPDWGVHSMNLGAGYLKGPLRAGTTLAFEPIASIGGQGYYLEDTFLIGKGGAELLTPGVPYSAEEIEAAMRGNRLK